MSIEIIAIVMFGLLFVALLMGSPLTFCLGGTAVIAAYSLWAPSSLSVIARQTFASSINFVLVACPLFILMGSVLQTSGLGAELYEGFYKWSGGLRGGLAIASILVCTVLAACTGITATATVMMGLVALPSMLDHGYDKKLAIGSIAGAGGLGILIPPSVPMVILSQATGLSVGRLFAGGIFSGLLISSLFISYVILMGLHHPNTCPALKEKVTFWEKLMSLRALAPPLLLIIIVLGFIFIGITTPTEAAAFGAFGALVVSSAKGRLNWRNLRAALHQTLVTTSMVFWIIFGAACFTSVFRALGAYELVENTIYGLHASPMAILVLMEVILLFLGMFLDPTGIIMIGAPVMCPIVEQLGFAPTWFGVIFIILIQIGYISPPFGYNLFYMKSVSPETSMSTIYKSVIPYILIMLFSVALVTIFPTVITWLPSILVKGGG